MPDSRLAMQMSTLEQRARSLNGFVFARAMLAFALLLVAVGLVGYLLITRPALERHAQWIAADLFPRSGLCRVDDLRRQLDLVLGSGASSGIELSSGTGRSPPGAGGMFGSLPFDALLARGIQDRIGVPVLATSSLRDVVLAFPCGGQRAVLRFDRSRALGAVPSLALLSWVVALVGGALALAAWLSRSLSRPLRKLSAHLRGTPLGAALSAAPNTGIIELNALADEVDALRSRASSAVATRSALLMGLSHDLRAPLARLRLILDTVAIPTADDVADMRGDTLELQDALDEFMRAANAMASPVIADGAMQGWLRLRQAYADPRLTFRGQPDLACPALNTAALVRVAANLIDNALRHTTGPVEVVWSPGSRWRLCVHDAGPGMSKDRVLSASQPFRSGRADTGAHAGLGLALATILCEHNGWLLTFGPASNESWQVCVEGI